MKKSCSRRRRSWENSVESQNQIEVLCLKKPHKQYSAIQGGLYLVSKGKFSLLVVVKLKSKLLTIHYLVEWDQAGRKKIHSVYVTENTSIASLPRCFKLQKECGEF